MNKRCRFLPKTPKGGEENDRELGGAAVGPIPQRPGGRPAPRPGRAPQPPEGRLRPVPPPQELSKAMGTPIAVSRSCLWPGDAHSGMAWEVCSPLLES